MPFFPSFNQQPFHHTVHQSLQQTVRRHQLFPITRWALSFLEPTVMGWLDVIGSTMMQLRLFAHFLRRNPFPTKGFLEAFSFIGVDALGVAMMLTLFSGMVIALQVATELTKQGAGEYVGGLVAISLLRELAPIMTGFAVIALNGSAYAAEISSMVIGQQVDALKMMHVDPQRLLVLPKLLGAIAAVPLMSILTAMAGLAGGIVVSYFIAGLNYNTFIESLWQFVHLKDIFGMMLKTAVFGALIILISTHYGLRARGGAKAVGEQTQKAVVMSFIAMAIADYFVSFMLFGDF